MRCSTPSKESANQQAESPRVNDLPKMMVTKLDGSQVNIWDLKGKIILILFQPDCDHCQREAEEIQKHLDAFKDYTLYFISADQMAAIQKFGNDYTLLDQPNIYFASTTAENVLNNFGPIPAPSMYIYNDQRLVQKFNGETVIEKVLEAI